MILFNKLYHFFLLGHVRFFPKPKTKFLPPLIIKFNQFLDNRNQKTEILGCFRLRKSEIAILGIFDDFGYFRPKWSLFGENRHFLKFHEIFENFDKIFEYLDIFW